MSIDAVETVLVVRKDHPDGKVLINKSDLLDSDTIYDPIEAGAAAAAAQKKAPAKKKSVKAD